MVKASGSPAGGRSKKGKKMQAGTREDSAERTTPQVDSRVQLEIGKHLRAHYDNVINEPVPDKFMELLEKLERSMARKS